MLALFVVMVISYFVGSIPSSIWVGKLTSGVDVRDHGSGNAGATNTFRILGWKHGVAVLLIDLFKGFACAFWISQLAYHIGSGPIAISSHWSLEPFLRIACGLVAVVGHMFPIFANFDGGKGMATATGMLLAIEPISVLIATGIFLFVMFTTRFVSLASLIAAFIYPIMLLVLRFVFGWAVDGSVLILGAVVGAGIIIKHFGNIRRLLNGTENQVGSFKPAKGWLNKEQKQTAA